MVVTIPEDPLGVHSFMISLLLYTGKRWLSNPSGDQVEEAWEGIEELCYKSSPLFVHLINNN